MLDELAMDFLEVNYYRLSPLGKRRARIMAVVKGFLCCGIMWGVGFGACALIYGLQCLMGVAN